MGRHPHPSSELRTINPTPFIISVRSLYNGVGTKKRRMTFSVNRWVMNGEEPTEGLWQLDPLPDGSDSSVRSITGRGPQGDGAWSVRLVPSG